MDVGIFVFLQGEMTIFGRERADGDEMEMEKYDMPSYKNTHIIVKQFTEVINLVG